MSKGSAANAQGNTGIGRSSYYDFSNRATDEYNRLFPFLNSEVTKPQGFGKALTPMKTEAGQSVAGSLGTADEKANLYGERTGNTAAVPGIIDASSRNALKQNSNNLLNIDIANEQMKNQQRQAGAAGEQGLFDESTKAALGSLGLSNQAIQDWTQGKAAADQNVMDWTKLALQTMAGGATMGLTASGVPT